MEALCVREVEELHRFFEGWFTGRLPSTDAAFARFERALSERFEITPPDGGPLDRATILARVRAAHGARAGSGFRIRIEDAAARLLGDGMYEARYEEWHEADGEAPRGRASRALMRQSPDAPNGVQWVRVEETWL